MKGDHYPATAEKQPVKTGFFAENRYLLTAFFASALVMLFVYFCFGLFPFGGSTILRMDLYHQYGPLFAELYERIIQMRSFLYSWNSGLGSGFLGNFFNYLSSPLSIIVVFFGHKNIPEAIATMVLLKAALSSAAFAYYIKKSLGKNDYGAAAFGVLYSFCGFFIAYYWNVMWLDAMFLFPLVMLGIERIVNLRKPMLFIGSMALTMIANYYMAYMVCLFSVIYFFIYFAANYRLSSLYGEAVFTLDDKGEKRYSAGQRLRHSVFLGFGLRFAFAALVAFCLAAFALIPLYYILQASSATSGSFPESYKSYFKIFDFLANHLAGLEPTIRSSGEDVLPNVYCGMATVLLVPLYLFSKTIQLKEKAAHVILLAILYFSFNINFANYVWHGFHFPNDLPYRFSFIYSFVLLVMAYKAFMRLKEYSGKDILAVGIAVVMGIVLVQELGSKNVSEATVIISLSFAVLYTLLFAVIKKSPHAASALCLIMMLSCVTEACIADTWNFSMNQKKADYASDLGDFTLLKKGLDAQNAGFYRMELAYLRTRMDPCWYDYNGASVFSSMAYEKTSNLQSKLGMWSNYINSYTYYPQTPVYNMMNAIQYLVDNDENYEPNPEFYRSLMSKGKFTAYENKYCLPVAYCASTALGAWNHISDNPFEVQGDYFEKATGISGVFERIPITDSYYYNVDEMYSGFDTGQFYYYKTNPGSEASITLVITPEVTQSCYLYIDAPNIKSFTASGEGIDLYKSDLYAYIIDLGELKAGESVSFEMPISEGDSGSLNFYAYGLNIDKFREGYYLLERGGMEFTDFDDSHILGTVDAQADCLLYTSIPYDPSWQITIDGEKPKSKDIVKLADAYLAVKLPKGKHTVEFNYVPRGLAVGSLISAGTLTAALLYLLITAIARKKKKRAVPPPLPVWNFNPPPAEPAPMFEPPGVFPPKPFGPVPDSPGEYRPEDWGTSGTAQTPAKFGPIGPGEYRLNDFGAGPAQANPDTAVRPPDIGIPPPAERPSPAPPPPDLEASSQQNAGEPAIEPETYREE